MGTPQEFNHLHVYFREQEYVRLLIEDVLACGILAG